jgi:hypothetical protein
MTIQVSIYSNDTLTNQGRFQSQEEAEAWVAKHGFSNPVYEDLTAKLKQDRINQECLQYLADTDWMIVRRSETGAEIPQEVLEKRVAARAAIVK